ncbi:DMT family transporter [Paenibacillus sp. MER 99-2]|uniref:DMT family transporter n=1 Tax=Paenibacillus sp. MER 99-2 TaxID=2939572 RepID=UPI00203F02F3|nr:DMT family transporter [Paenibacillus sp. MER 99-2]MCM3171924.1 DMT family transporter [Paenibacillus sp. MER 99-2]
MSKKVGIGTLLCLIASMSWGAMFPVAHSALQRMDPLYFSFYRYLFVTIILVVLLYFKEGKQAFRFEGLSRKLLFYGTMGFTLYNFMIFSGQDLMGESGTIVASIMEALMPMITIVILWYRTKSTPAKATLTSMTIALIGALLVITNGNLSFFMMARDHLLPVLLIFMGAIGWVVYSLGGGSFPQWSVLRYSTLTCLLGTVVSFVIVTSATLLQWLPAPHWNELLSIKYEMLFMIFFPGTIALLSWNAGMKMLSPVNGILFISLVPVTTFVVMSFQGYSVSLNEFYGALLVIFALIQNNLFQRKSVSQTSVRGESV